jgi:hypothetical protein
MTDVIVGQKLAAATTLYTGIGPTTNNQAAFYKFVAASPGLLHKLGMFARGFAAKNSNVQLAIWDTISTTNLNPGPLLGYTGPIIITGTTAALWEAPLVWSNMMAEIGSPAAVRLVPGRTYWIGVQDDVYNVQIFSAVGTVLSNVPHKTVAVGNPTNPFGTYVAVSERQPAMYGVVTVPTGPVATPTTPSGDVNTAIPTFVADLFDAEAGTPTYDRVARYAIQVRKFGATALTWAPGEFTASTTERSAETLTKLYGGPSLEQTDYEWRIQATDDTGTVGDWSNWEFFTVTNLGSLDIASASPLGKQENGVVTNWIARWTHPGTPPLNANAARVRIKSAGIVQRGGDTAPFITLSPTVPNASFITIPDTTALLTHGPNPPLPSGAYTWEMQARDTGGSITAWSDGVAFNVNFPPNKPSGLRPISGSRLASRPRIDWFVSDLDYEDILGGDLISLWEVTDPAGTVRSGRTSNLDIDTGRGYLDLTVAEAPTNGDYRWRVMGVDQSGEAAGTGIGPWSDPVTFTLVAAPIITITVPAQNATVFTSAPQILWTVTGGSQAFFRVQLYRANEVNPFYGSGRLVAPLPGSGAFVVPSGVLENEHSYDAEVTIWTAGDIVSISALRRFAVAYPPADLITDVAVSPKVYDGDWEAVTNTVSWHISGSAASAFAGYVITRRGASQDPADAIPIAHIKQVAQTVFDDHHPPPNENLVYGVRQLLRSGANILQSPVSEAYIAVPLSVPFIASLITGAEIRAPVIMLRDDYSEGFTRDESTVPTWGTGGKPTLIRSPDNYGQVSVSVGFTIRNDERGTLHEHMAQWRDIMRTGHPVSLRTETERLFMHVIPQAGWLSRTALVGVWSVQLALEEIAWTEAVPILT